MSLDRDTLEEIAAKCLERPSDAMFWDDRLFTTHGALFHWAELGDDILEESNYLSALELIKGAAGDDADEHVIDGTSRHWACGSLRTIYVQVYADNAMRCRDCGEVATCIAKRRKRDRRRFYCALHGEQWVAAMQFWNLSAAPLENYRAEFTPAFIEAAELAYGLLDYPIIDESDYSEREWNVFEETLKEAVEHAQGEYVLLDSDEEAEAIVRRFYEDEGNAHRQSWCRAEDVDWEVVAEEYAEARDAYFLERAYEVYRWNVLGYNPDQLELDFAV
ncbi:hypothetical protein [Streptomyces werraensis]|uniref:hypothetical protein n=1 Tax=Streptomyces werraensis TaxID=68284 RepID=UPI003809EFFA